MTNIPAARPTRVLLLARRRPTGCRHRCASPHARGSSLLEALVAAALLAFAVLVTLQAWMLGRHSTAQAQQQLTALHAAHAVLDDAVWAAANADAHTDSAHHGSVDHGSPPSAYTAEPLPPGAAPELVRRAAGHALNPWWTDLSVRLTASGPQDTAAAQLMPAIEHPLPAWVAAVAASRQSGWMPVGLTGRHVRVPPHARDLGNGRSSHAAPGSSWHYLFDNATGLIVGRCDSPPEDAEVVCEDDWLGLWLGGSIWFAAQDHPSPEPAAGDTTGDATSLGTSAGNGTEDFNGVNNLSGLAPARDLDLHLDLLSSNHPEPGAVCHDNASHAQANGLPRVSYACIVRLSPHQPLGWSGDLSLLPLGDRWGAVPPRLGHDAGQLRVCHLWRDAPEQDRAGHPPGRWHYADVGHALWSEHLLVIPGPGTCQRAPTGTGVAAAG